MTDVVALFLALLLLVEFGDDWWGRLGVVEDENLAVFQGWWELVDLMDAMALAGLITVSINVRNRCHGGGVEKWRDPTL